MPSEVVLAEEQVVGLVVVVIDLICATTTITLALAAGLSYVLSERCRWCPPSSTDAWHQPRPRLDPESHPGSAPREKILETACRPLEGLQAVLS